MELLYRLGVLRPVFFEPDPVEAGRLKDRYKSSTVFDCALSDKVGSATLYLTRDLGCLSLLRPINQRDVEKRENISTQRADTLLIGAERELHPEIVKIDVQGGELAVLKGFGDLLESVTCIETEVSFRKTYENQPLVECVTEFLMDHGFGLIDLRVFGVRSTRAAVQANAFFARQKLQSERQVVAERVFRTANKISLAF